ncbi:MAG: DUF1304 domain-containing protein [Pseudomonadota bacterium]
MITYWLCVFLLVSHIGFGITEMFFWKKLGGSLARNRDRCGLDDENLDRALKWSSFMAFNQGVYNLFLAAGFFFCLDPNMRVESGFVEFFSSCVIVAGLAGWYCGIRTVLYVQTIPGVLLFTANALAI